MDDSFTRVCAAAEVPEGSLLAVEVNGEPIAIAHTEGEFFAIRDVCSHEEIALSEGELEGSTVECWLHGSRFDLRTGEPLELPATEPVDVYPIRVDGDDVYVAVHAEESV